MRYKGDIGLYISGAPVPLPEANLFITQPKIKQIMQFGETNFLTAVQLLVETEVYLKEVRMGNPELESKSDFQLLLVLINEDKTIRTYLSDFFELTFPDYEVIYDKNSINFCLRDDEEKTVRGMLTIYSFAKFQRIIKELFVATTDKDDSFNPANEVAQEIAKKLEKARQKKAQEEGSDDGNMTLYGTYASILAIGLQMDINTFFEYTPFQIVDSFTRYWIKDKFDFYRKLSATPLMDVSKMDEPEEWTKNLYPCDNN